MPSGQPATQLHGIHLQVRALLWLQPAVGIALFPIAVWSIEIVQGYALIFLFRRNVAWWYHGRDAFFRGTIKLGHWWAWLLLVAPLAAALVRNERMSFCVIRFFLASRSCASWRLR